MELNKENIVGTFRLKDGNKYVFLADETVYKEEPDGKLTKIELNKKNIKKIQDDIGAGKTDVVR